MRTRSVPETQGEDNQAEREESPEAPRSGLDRLPRDVALRPVLGRAKIIRSRSRTQGHPWTFDELHRPVLGLERAGTIERKALPEMGTEDDTHPCADHPAWPMLQGTDFAPSSSPISQFLTCATMPDAQAGVSGMY